MVEHGGHEAGLPEWPMLPLGDWTREFECLKKDLRVGIYSELDSYSSG